MTEKGDILAVEDDHGCRTLLTDILTANGYAVRTVGSGELALAAVKAKAPELILLDIKMPGLDGFEVLKRLKADPANSEIPVIFLSVVADTAGRVNGLRLGAVDFISKPFQKDELLARVRTHTELFQLRKKLEQQAQELAGERDRLAARLAEAEQAKMSLKESETRLNKAQLVALVGNWEIDLKTHAVWTSEEARRIYGVPPAKQATLKLVQSIVLKQYRPALDLALRRLIAGEAGYDQEFEIKQQDTGEILWLHSKAELAPDKDGTPKVAGVIQDITASKRAQAGVREAYEMQGMLNTMLQRSLANVPLKEKLGGHLASLLAAPWLSVEARGAVFLANPMSRELILTAHQGLAPVLLTACARVPFGRCICGAAAATGLPAVSRSVGPEHHITYKGIHPHGHYCAPIMAEVKVLGVLNLYLKEGDALTEGQERFVKAAADVMAVNIVHSQVEDKLTHSQKMEAVGLLAGGVAHDFNNILTAIKCYAGFVQKDLPPGNPKFADAQEILNSAERAIGLTRQLLAFSRRQIMAPRVVDINKIFGEMSNMLRRIIGENIALETGLFSAPCLAMADPGQIEQVILNLAVNARDAMPGGGKLILETEITNPPEEFFDTRPDLPIGPLVCFRVRDTGTGMTAEVTNRLFEPFFTTKEQGKGTGLGLAMVFGIIKQSNGEIEVESELGKGTTFTVYLPFMEACLITEKPKEKTKGSPLKGHETVLLVEDEDTLRRLGERILRTNGYTVLATGDGAAALKLMEGRGKPVDLLLTDVVMPGMSGRELALELTRRKMVGRAIYMSGYTDDTIVKHGVLEQGIAFIYKPFTVDALLLKVREVLDGPASQAKA